VRRQYLQIFPTDFIYRPSNFSPWSYLPTHRCTCANDNVFRAMPFMASMAFASLLSWAKLWCFLGWLLDDRWMRCALFLNDLGFKCWWILRLCLTLILTCYCLINTLSLIAEDVLSLILDDLDVVEIVNWMRFYFFQWEVM
jgi:hypothetical protein